MKKLSNLAMALLLTPGTTCFEKVSEGNLKMVYEAHFSPSISFAY